MTGQTIVKAEIRRPDLRWPFPTDMGARLEGATVVRLRRRSKYLLADLSTDETLIIHLGMSGRLSIEGDGRQQTAAFHREHGEPGKHDHVIMHLNSGHRIVFNDPRRFGAMDLMATARLDDHRLLAAIGPEPLGNAFSADTLATAFAGRRAPVRAVLLDQRVVAGLGNIYVAEALWRAGISPFRAAGRIARPRLERLVVAIRETLADAIEAGGSSLRDFRQADGELGYFQHRFSVYDREGSVCSAQNCNDVIVRRVLSGRSSFHCPTCQR